MTKRKDKRKKQGKNLLISFLWSWDPGSKSTRKSEIFKIRREKELVVEKGKGLTY